jgi:hypothetical protein
VPGAPILESPVSGSYPDTPVAGRFGGAVSGSASYENVQDALAPDMSSRKVEPRLGANIYASNLKVMGKVDEEEERVAAARLQKPDAVEHK